MSLTSAHEFRTKGAALAHAKTEGFVGIYFGQCTTLSTRIRCYVRISFEFLSVLAQVTVIRV